MSIGFTLLARRAGTLALLGPILCGGCGSNPKQSVPPPPSAVCASGPVTVTEPSSVTSISENFDETCVSVVGTLPWKMGAPGSPCTNPLDCSPVCCVCPGAQRHTFTTWCDQGACASNEAACCMVLGTNLTSCTEKAPPQ